MPRVISYTRFSSRKQAKGDSYRRQTEMALAWCQQNGYELDTSLVLEDLGVSGYSGANAKRGALGVLQLMALNGELEHGTILLIEAFDRLTRKKLPDAVSTVLDLVHNGLTIVTLTDNKTWTKESLSDIGAFLQSILTLQRGYEESSYKSKRLQATFGEARLSGSKQPFGAAPGWLWRESKEAPWQVIEEKAEVVRRVFHYAAIGLGSKAIAGIANTEGWPVPMRLNKTEGRWHGQMAGNLLRNRAVLGEHEHRIHTHEAHDEHWRGRPSGIKVDDYYPRIVSDEEWHKARAAIDTKPVETRRDTHYYNIFAGMMFCGYCGAPMQRKSEARSLRKHQLVCADKISGATKDCRNMMANNADFAILHAIYEYATVTGSLLVSGAAGTTGVGDLAIVESKIKELTESIERIVESIASGLGGSAALNRKLGSLEGQLVELQKELEKKQQEAAVVSSGSLFDGDSKELEAFMPHLYTPGDKEARDARSNMHLKLSQVIDTIWVWGYDLARIKFKDGPSLMPVALIPKQLPSRVNPEAKYHKPPKPRPKPPQPYLQQALHGTLPMPPKPRRNRTLGASKAEATAEQELLA